jgi:hypothetical protein
MRYLVVPARDVEQLEAARELFGEYIAWLDIAIAFQGFAAELAHSRVTLHRRLATCFWPETSMANSWGASAFGRWISQERAR